MRKSCLFLVMVFLVCVLACQSKGEALFSDDFESGNLDLWTIGGRQQGLANVAEVVDKHGSKMGHLYHQGFTDISIEKVFDFNHNLAFSFDMEVEVTGGKYASGEAEIWFRDSGENRIGKVSYMKATSSYVFDLQNPLPNYELFRIPDEAGLTSYSVTMQELLTYITLDENLIDTVQLRFLAYSSNYSSSFTSNVWVDNVVVTPEPATIVLLCLGSLSLVKRRRIITKKDNYFKRSGSMKKYFLTTILMMFLSIGGIFANAKASMTIATFADPSNDSNNPLFTVDFTQMKLNGGWDQTGLILEVPYSGNTFENAWFDMTEVTMFPAMGDMYPTGPGVINFYENNFSTDPLVVIDFNSGLVTSHDSFGANEMFIAYNVTITGSEITGTLSEEQFSFGFANLAPLLGNSDLNNGFTATASFTSSAIPEPATLCVLCLGTLLVSRKKNV